MKLNIGRKIRLSIFNTKQQEQVDEKQRILNDKSDFNVVEAYKSIRTNIMFSMPKTENGKVIVITSSIPGEGKTTTTINLALTFAQTGARVLLLDCDLRKSRTHRYLQMERTEGVSNVLCGFTTLDKAIKKNVRDGLDCLTAGEIPPNPAELIESEEFGKMISTLREKYDYIFIDTPPITVVTDAAVAMRQSDGTVVVVRQDLTTFDMLDETMENIDTTGTKIIGVIMLGSEEKHGKYGYYKNGKYGYKYGYKYNYSYSDDEEKKQ